MPSASAPGKVHLIGEHAVVYGKPAIIASIGKRCFVTAEKSENIEIISSSLNLNKKFTIEDSKLLYLRAKKEWIEGKEKKDFSRLFALMKQDYYKPIICACMEALSALRIRKGIKVGINSEIPLGSGLGSSSAMAVAMVKAISEAYGKKLVKQRVNEIAYEIEKLNHGMPSGGDNSTCCYGRLIWFQKNANGPNIIQPLENEIPYALDGFLLVHTGKPEKTTGELVQHVMRLEESYRNARIEILGKATYEMLAALKRKDFSKAKHLMNLAQRNLAELGVSTKQIDGLAEKVVSIGGAAKLCGAGGGGTVLCYHEDREKLAHLIKESGYSPIETELGVEGVRVEK